MAIKFYTDEHIHPAVVTALRKQKVDILTAQEAGQLGIADESHLQFAASQGRSIITQDRDFLRLHQKNVAHHGIIYSRQGTSIREIINGLRLIHEAMTEEEMLNHVEFL